MLEQQGAKLNELLASHQQRRTGSEDVGEDGARQCGVGFRGILIHDVNVSGNIKVSLLIHNECKQLRLLDPVTVILTTWWL
jgi:hypothetical protein